VKIQLGLGQDRAEKFDVSLSAAGFPGAVGIGPRTAEAPADVIPVTFTFRQISAGGDFQGKLIVTARGALFPAQLEIPVTGVFRTRLTRLPTDGETLTILSWPPNAEAYLSDLNASRPGVRKFVGLTPVRSSLAVGSYRVLLLAPKDGPGRWAGPVGMNGILEVAGKSHSCLDVVIATEKSSPALVRALWLPNSPRSTADRLADATEGAADLYAVPPFASFEIFATRALAKTGIALSTDDARKLHRALPKTGFLSYEVRAGRGAVDLEFRPGNRAEPFSYKAHLLE
jgi:hypothetical protein